jgi:hypothetical protein
MNRDGLNELVDILGSRVLDLLHHLGLVNEIFDGLVFEITLGLVVQRVNVENLDGDKATRGYLSAFVDATICTFADQLFKLVRRNVGPCTPTHLFDRRSLLSGQLDRFSLVSGDRRHGGRRVQEMRPASVHLAYFGYEAREEFAGRLCAIPQLVQS